MVISPFNLVYYGEPILRDKAPGSRSGKVICKCEKMVLNSK